ncbi:MAG: hypothetical protein H7A51_19525 [Akkermansiaceae bacterium]|nr:hypothetical protein [Akkermansiaceae bacterium]
MAQRLVCAFPECFWYRREDYQMSSFGDIRLVINAADDSPRFSQAVATFHEGAVEVARSSVLDVSVLETNG